MGSFDLAALRIEIDQIAEISSPWSVKPYLEKARDRLGLANVSYRLSENFRMNIGDSNSAFTYPKEWSDRYLSKEYGRIDPVANFDLACTAPKTWRELQELNPALSWLFREAESYGVGRHAVSVPVRSVLGTSGIISLTTFDTDQQWNDREMQYRAIACILGSHIHDRLLSLDSTLGATKEISLTGRQRECLLLLARGKSVKEIAADLCISGTMVRAHLHSARIRLGAPTIASALLKASTLALLPQQ